MKVHKLNISAAKDNLGTLKDNSYKNNRRSGILLVESLNNVRKFQQHTRDDLDSDNPEWASEELLTEISTVIGMLTGIKKQSKSKEISGSYGVTVGINILECIHILENIQEDINKN